MQSCMAESIKCYELKFFVLLCLSQADICWNVVVKCFAESQIRRKYIAFSHFKINAYNCFVQKL